MSRALRLAGEDFSLQFENFGLGELERAERFADFVGHLPFQRSLLDLGLADVDLGSRDIALVAVVDRQRGVDSEAQAWVLLTP